MERLHKKQIAIIGSGNIGQILLKRLLSTGIPPKQLIVYDTDVELSVMAAKSFGVRSISLIDETIYTADVLLIATPPPVVRQVVETLADHLKPGQVIVSFAAAVPVTTLATLVPAGVSVVRVMPNAPSAVGCGMNPVVYDSSVSEETRDQMQALLSVLGETVEVQDEQMNWCVGLTGAAMRSLLPVLEGMTQAGIEAGLPAKDARRVAAQVMLGTASLTLEIDLPFDELKAMTPMETVDEATIAKLFFEAAQGARTKVEGLQQKLAIANM
jgi:pyrroline-5-carboxylate reductase